MSDSDWIKRAFFSISPLWSDKTIDVSNLKNNMKSLFQNQKGSDMKTGRIKKRMDKGFGFIEANGDEYFFHTSQCITKFDSLAAGDKVKFNTEDSPKGPRAVDVEKI